jgi:hypothetical protein
MPFTKYYDTVCRAKPGTQAQADTSEQTAAQASVGFPPFQKNNPARRNVPAHARLFSVSRRVNHTGDHDVRTNHHSARGRRIGKG